MAKPARHGADVPGEGETSSFAIYGLWGGVTVAGILAVVVAASSGIGSQRVVALSGAAPVPPPAPVAAAPAPQPLPPQQAPVIVRTDPALVAETQRLAELVRQLAADRDRLAQRLDQVERTVGDVTASIPRNPPPVSEAPKVEPKPDPPKPPETAAKPEPSKPEPSKPAEPPREAPAAAAPLPIQPAVPVPQPRVRPDTAASESVATRTEFGVDLGGDTSIEGLKALWNTIRSSNGQLVGSLRPLVAVRDGPRPGTVELRLVAGPLANAAAAARLCAALATTGLACQPTGFDGQRLALR